MFNLESTLYDKRGVLDHGYVKLVEYWGSDERIIESARMSTNKGFEGWEKDRKLLAYLYNNKHMTPFEMGGLVFEIKAPIFVYREWHRHRTQCLVGDTKITLVTPNGTTFKRAIREIFDLRHGGVVDSAPAKHRNGYSQAGKPMTRGARRKNAWRTRVLPNCQHRTLRVLDEATGVFHTALMKDVWESGVKPVFKVTAGQYQVTASAEHPFFTARGWIKTKELVAGDRIARMGKVATDGPPLPPALRKGIGVWTSMMRTRLLGDSSKCYKCGEIFPKKDIELDHVIPVTDDLKLALDEKNLAPICVDCHLVKSAGEQPDRREQTRRGVRWEKVTTLPEFVGEEMTYDIEVSGTHHNYCANDLVVHNSYNEMSARYIPLPDENYTPDVEDLILRSEAAQSTANKQAGASTSINAENALNWVQELNSLYAYAQKVYEQGLKLGVPKELARLSVPVARYSKMRASANLRNWLQFLALRLSPHAQKEIRLYAQMVSTVIGEVFPETHNLFMSDLNNG